MTARTEEVTGNIPADHGIGARQQATAVIAMLLIWIVAALDKLVVFLLVGPIRADLRLTDFQMSFVLGTAFALAYAIGGLPFGYLADRVNRRAQIFLAVLVWSVLSMACGLATGFISLFVMRALVGLAEAAYPPARDSLIADTVPAERLGTANAVMTCGGVIGGGLALILGGVITGSVGTEAVPVGPFLFKPWQMVFLLTGGGGLLLLPVLLFVREPLRRREQPSDAPAAAGFFGQMRSRGGFYVGMLGGMALLSAVSNGVTAWAPTYLNRNLGLSMMQAGLWLGIIQSLGIMVSLALSGWCIDRFYRRGVRRIHAIWTLGVAILTIPVAFAMFQVRSATAFFVIFALYCVVQVGYSVSTAAGLQVNTPSQYRGRISALYYLVLNIVGFGVGPTLIAGVGEFVFHDTQDLRAPMMTVIMLGSALAAIVVLLAVRERPAEAVEATPSPA